MSENFQAYLKLDTSKLINQYVVIINGRVFATGQDIEEMLKKARKKYPGKIPFVAKVPDKELLVL
jgi:enoyl-CoA hydratase/carnithine racemase